MVNANGLLTTRTGFKSDYADAFRVGKVEAYLRSIFTRWGRICGAHPLKVIVASLVLSGCIIVGVLNFNVTTDPVQLWSAPNSLARQQMNAYDNAFGPFYRTTQVIITAPDLPGEVYLAWDNSALSTTPIYFSGMFNRSALFEILDFQNTILGLTAEYNGQTVTIADICLRPLCNDTATSRDPNCGIANCTIFSPLNWFQNDLAQMLLVCIAHLPLSS